VDSILVVFYSYTGVSRRAAQLIAAHYDWPMGEIRDARPRAGFVGGLRCLLDSLFRRRPAIRYEGPDPAGFRTVILISPIWAYRMAGPMRSFLAERGARIRRFAQVTLMNAVGSSQAVAEAQQLIGHPAVLTVEFLSREFEDGTGTAHLLRFGETLTRVSTSSGASDWGKTGGAAHA
jgi:flavodoxin